MILVFYFDGSGSTSKHKSVVGVLFGAYAKEITACFVYFGEHFGLQMVAAYIGRHSQRDCAAWKNETDRRRFDDQSHERAPYKNAAVWDLDQENLPCLAAQS